MEDVFARFHGAQRSEHFQFDAFWVFIWNPRRARYETAHRERNLRGYHPVKVEPGRIELVYRSGPDSPVERHAFELRGRKLHLLSHTPAEEPAAQDNFAAPLADGGIFVTTGAAADAGAGVATGAAN